MKTFNTQPEQTLTIRQALEYINSHAHEKLPNQNADTVRIIEFTTGLNETGVLQSLNSPLSSTQAKKLYRTIDLLCKGTPLEYITGISDFHSRHFYVSRDTLIPRVETETLVDLTVACATTKCHLNDNSTPLTLVDVGTGSGCIIVSTALCLRQKNNYFATDISPAALKIAKRNVGAYSMGRNIKLLLGNLLDAVPSDIFFDIVVANLPYITRKQMPRLPKSVSDFEPHLALDGGPEGTTYITELLIQSKDRLKKKGVILIEIQPTIIGKVRNQLKKIFPNATVSAIPDPFRVERFMMIET